MSFRSYREESKKNYGAKGDSNLTRDQIQLGAILRIADATEKMCLDREKLERDYQYMRNSRDRYRSQLESAERRIAALKGVITKMKNKAAREVTGS